jgi:hypothetical protein
MTEINPAPDFYQVYGLVLSKSYAATPLPNTIFFILTA